MAQWRVVRKLCKIITFIGNWRMDTEKHVI